jgi:hypothetical protein
MLPNSLAMEYFSFLSRHSGAYTRPIFSSAWALSVG